MRLFRLNPQQLLAGDHCYLDPTDECYFGGPYECCQRPGVRPLILSLKRGRQSAILGVAKQLALALPGDWARTFTFVPMPPSSGTTSAVESVAWRLPVADVR